MNLEDVFIELTENDAAWVETAEREGAENGHEENMEEESEVEE